MTAVEKVDLTKHLARVSDGPRPAPLVILCPAPGTERERISGLIEGLLRTGKVAVEVDGSASLEAVDQRLNEQPDTRVLLVGVAPEAALVAAMAEGMPPQDSLTAWSDMARAILRVVRSHRQQVVLVDAAMALRHPEALLREVSAEAGRAAVPSPQAADGPDDPVLRLLAAEILRRNPEAQALAGELEASASNLFGHGASPGPDVDAVFTRYREMLSHIRDLDRLAEANRAESDRILHQLLRTQEDLAGRNAELARLRSRVEKDAVAIEAKNARLRGLSARRKDIEARLEEKTGEADRLGQQLLQTTQSLESHQVQVAGIEVRLKAAVDDAAGLREQVSEMTRDLGKVRKTLEERNLMVTEKSAKLHAVSREKRQLAARAARLGERERGLSSELAVAKETLSAIHASKSYRLMSPLRRLRAVIARRRSGHG